MARGGFHLRKWAANLIELLEDIPPGEHELAIERPLDKNDTLKILGFTWILSGTELMNASLFWFHYVQECYFASELQALKNNRPLPKSSSLLSLHPFLGKDKLICLGGRIGNSSLNYNEQHLIILPKHRISDY